MNLTTNKPLLAGVGVILLGVLGWLAFGFFGIQSAFIDNEVDEGGPIFTATASVQDDVAVDSTELTVYTGSFAGTSRYEISGQADVLNDGSEQRFLRFEDFESSNGPDLKVYLRADNGDFVSLGDLKGNIGAQNYEIPADVDLSVFSTVDIWCERFGVGFGSAPLTAT